MRIFFLLLCFSSLWGAWVSQTAIVKEIIDGDTIKVSLSPNTFTNVRLLYIDSFETSRGNKMTADIKKLRTSGYSVTEKLLLSKGTEAKRWLIYHIPPKTRIRLEWDNEKPNDRYGRLLALVYTLSPENCINEELILTGLARPYFVGKTPETHRKRIENAYQQAINTGKWQWLEKTKK